MKAKVIKVPRLKQGKARQSKAKQSKAEASKACTGNRNVLEYLLIAPC